MEHRPAVRTLLTIAGILVASCALSACGGGGGSAGFGQFGGGFGSNGSTCDPGTEVQLANPLPGTYGVPSNIGQVTIVAYGNANTLYDSYGNWSVILFDQFGDQFGGGTLSLVSDAGGPHPYPSDFYYASSVSTLPPGRTWNAYLAENANCQPVSLGTFST